MSSNDDNSQTTEAICPVCGIVAGQEDCAGDEGYGCPWWEDFKADHPPDEGWLRQWSLTND